MKQLQCSIRLQLQDFRLDINLDAELEGMTAIIGPSGAGKTSLLQCLAGFKKGGDIQVNWNHERWQTASQFVPPHRRGIAYVLQRPYLFQHLSVANNFYFGQKPSQPQTETIIQDLGLEPLFRRRVSQLSGGERQRLALGRCLLQNPKLWLLDEPLSALDQQNRAAILEVFQKALDLSAAPALFVTHHVEDVLPYVKQVLVINEGKVAFLGPLPQACEEGFLLFGSQQDRGSILQGDLMTYDATNSLARLKLGEQTILIPAAKDRHEDKGKIKILAKDIFLSHEALASTSLINSLRGIITEISGISGSYCLVKIKVDKQILVAQVTQYGRESLKLRQGLPIWANFSTLRHLAVDG